MSRTFQIIESGIVVDLSQQQRPLEPLLPIHRDAMLDVVLAWAKIDAILQLLYVRVKKVDHTAVIDEIGKWSTHYTFHQVRLALQDYSDPDEGMRYMRREKRNYEKHSKVRNIIAHTPCIGYTLSSTEHVVFAPFYDKAGNHLELKTISLTEITSARDWGEKFYLSILGTLNTLDSDQIPTP